MDLFKRLDALVYTKRGGSTLGAGVFVHYCEAFVPRRRIAFKGVWHLLLLVLQAQAEYRYY